MPELPPGVVIGHEVHGHGHAVAERELCGVARTEDGAGEYLVDGNAKGGKRAPDLLRLLDAGRREVALTGTIVQAPGIHFVLVGGRVPQIDHLAAILHGSHENLGFALRMHRDAGD